MEVSEHIANARVLANAYARMARVLARLKPVLKVTGTVVMCAWSGPEIIFTCQTVEDADKVAMQVPVKIDLHYTGHSSLLTFETEIGDVKYEFRVSTKRPITIDQCDVKRKKRRNWGDWYDAHLYFNEYELVKISYKKEQRILHKELKAKLWATAIEQRKTNQRLERFDFVL